MGSALSACTARDDDDLSEKASSIWDVYDVGERLGSGNFGEVRACRRRDGDSEELAVKIVDRQSKVVQAAEAFQTAKDELEIMSGIHHPNVVELKEIFEEERFLYVVMERIGGGELFKAISDKRAVVMEDDVARVGAQLLEAVEYLHSSGIVHRDVKAQNILLTEPPQVPGRALQSAGVKLIDFGLAARLRQDCLGSDPQQLDLVCGTPAMCAPEIWAAEETAPKVWKKLWGQAYGPKVDVWASGVVLYMALFGTLPFLERQAARLAEKVCDPRTKPNYTSRNPSYRVSPGCKKFLGTLLEKDQKRRATSAEACEDPWLTGRSRKRGLQLEPIPPEVLEAAHTEAQAALAERMPPGGLRAIARGEDGVSTSTESSVLDEEGLAERRSAFEAVRLEATTSRASARSRHLPSIHERGGHGTESDAGSAEEDGRGLMC